MPRKTWQLVLSARDKFQTAIEARMRLVVVVSIAVVLVLVPALAITNALLLVERGHLQSEVTADTAFVKSQQTAQELAAKVRLQASQQSCRQGIAGIALANNVILQLKGGYLDIAKYATNPKVVHALRARAATIHRFMPPKCDPGPAPKAPANKPGKP